MPVTGDAEHEARASPLGSIRHHPRVERSVRPLVAPMPAATRTLERRAVHTFDQARPALHGSDDTMRKCRDILREHSIVRTVVKSRLRE